MSETSTLPMLCVISHSSFLPVAYFKCHQPPEQLEAPQCIEISGDTVSSVLRKRWGGPVCLIVVNQLCDAGWHLQQRAVSVSVIVRQYLCHTGSIPRGWNGWGCLDLFLGSDAECIRVKGGLHKITARQSSDSPSAALKQCVWSVGETRASALSTRVGNMIFL